MVFESFLLSFPFEVSMARTASHTVGPIQAFFAAQEAVDTLLGNVERRPDVCRTRGAPPLIYIG